MPSRFRIRRLFKGKLVDLIARKFAKIHIKPNHITAMGPILAIIAVISFFWGGKILGSIIFSSIIFIIMIFDGVDGALARITGMKSSFGGFFDSIMDRYTDFILIFSFILIYNPYIMSDNNFYFFIPLFYWVTIALVGILLTSYSRSLAEKLSLEDTDIGLLGRSERLLILCITGYFLIPILGLIILAVFSNLTALFRVTVYGIKLSKKE